eukprot:3402138-Heterocapsa_arctica.AAC.1
MNGGKGTEFIRYTIPALELRVMLGGARKMNESFSLEYTQIRANDGVAPGISTAGDEAWRADGCGRRVSL